MLWGNIIDEWIEKNLSVMYLLTLSRYNAYRAKHANTSISIHDQQDYTYGKQIRVSVFLNTIISLNKYSTIFNLRWR